jgi:hypothetical protein
MSRTVQTPEQVLGNPNAYIDEVSVVAYNSTGLSSETQLATPPSNLVVQRTSPTSATITWHDPNDPDRIAEGPDPIKDPDTSAEEGQYIDMTLPDGGVNRIFVGGALLPDTTYNYTYTINNLEADANYAFSAGAWTKEADSNSAWVVASRIKPTNQVLSLTAAAIGDSTIHLSWLTPHDSAPTLGRRKRVITD